MDATQIIKDKAIKDFLNLLKRANLGYYDNYQRVLAEITFIEMGAKLDNPTSIYERLINM